MRGDVRIGLIAAGIFCFSVAAFVLGDESTVLAPSKHRSCTPKAPLSRGKSTVLAKGENRVGRPTLFDPNTADTAMLMQVGLSRRTALSVVRYRNKGGVFRKPADLARIYGITPAQYAVLLPYIRIGDEYKTVSPWANTKREQADTVRKPRYELPKKIAKGQTVDLNTADTTVLKTVPGIGSFYARRIVDVRSRLGAFVSVAQLKDIAGVPDEAIAYFEVANGTADKALCHIKKINLNTAEFKLLAAHPYIGYARAREIMRYRQLKGDFENLSALSLLPSFSEQDISRLAPYAEL